MESKIKKIFEAFEAEYTTNKQRKLDKKSWEEDPWKHTVKKFRKWLRVLLDGASGLLIVLLLINLISPNSTIIHNTRPLIYLLFGVLIVYLYLASDFYNRIRLIEKNTKKLTSIQNFLNYQTNTQNLLFHNLRGSISILLERVEIKGSDDYTKEEKRTNGLIKKYFTTIAGIKDKSISDIERYFWALLHSTDHGPCHMCFYYILNHMLSGEKVHFAFKTISFDDDTNTCLDTVAISLDEKPSYLMVEPQNAAAKYYDTKEDSENFADIYWKLPFLRVHEIYNLSESRSMYRHPDKLLNYAIVSSIYWSFSHRYNDFPQNITFEGIEDEEVEHD